MSKNLQKIRSVCVYCGASTGRGDAYQAAAAELGRFFATEDIRLVYGGGSFGLMGEVSAACMTESGHVTGIIPRHLFEKEGQNHAITELVQVDNMHERKRKMVDESDAFVILPGGLGTLDEAFEILTWKYLGLHDKPIVFLNIEGYFNPLLAMIDHMVEQGFTPFWHRALFHVVEDISDVLRVMKAQPEHLETDTSKI